jgi:mono/diheme cytochrome c family protein
LLFTVLVLAFSHDQHRHGVPLVRDPGPADPASIERGARLFATACATCHGRTGDGGGPRAPGLSPSPADLTFHVPLHSDGEIFRSISEGVHGTAMPVWREQLTEQQLWALVSFLRAEFSQTGTAVPEG